MHQLSGLDATFLYLETPEMPMHVGALHVLELPAGFRGRFAMYIPPLMEALGLVELEHNKRNNRMRAL